MNFLLEAFYSNTPTRLSLLNKVYYNIHTKSKKNKTKQIIYIKKEKINIIIKLLAMLII